MAMAVAPHPPGPPETRKFTADDVWRMLEAGILDADEPYELLDGELHYVSPPDPLHAKVVNRLTMLLVPVYGPRGFVVRTQQPIGGIINAIPEPDVAIVTLAAENADTHPQADQAVLLVEVAHTRLPRDLRKGAVYAIAGAPEYWIVDVNRNVVTFYAGPNADGTWRHVTEVGIDGRLPLPQTDGQTLAVARILMPAG